MIEFDPKIVEKVQKERKAQFAFITGGRETRFTVWDHMNGNVESWNKIRDEKIRNGEI